MTYPMMSGCLWRMMPHDLPPWHAVYRQTQRWLKAGVFGILIRDLRMLMREIDDRTQLSTPVSGGRAGWDGHKRRKGLKLHMVVDTLGQLLAILVTPANEQDRAQVSELAKQIQEVIGDSVEVMFVDLGYTDEEPAAADQAHGIRLEVIRMPTSNCGLVLPGLQGSFG